MLLNLPNKIRNYLLEHEQDRLFLFAPVFFGIGICFYFSLFNEPPLKLAIIAFAVCAILFAIYFYKLREISLFLSACLLISSGFLLANLRTISQKSVVIDADLGVVWVRGEVENIKAAEYGSKIILKKLNLWQPDYGKFDALETPVKIRLSSRIKQPENIKVGDYIQVKAILNPPEKLPIFLTGYDFAKVAYFNQIGGVGFTIAPIKILEPAPANLAATEKLKEYFKQKLFANTTPNDNTAINYALTTGDDSFISDATKQQIRDASLGHILAVSGLHMSLVMAGVFIIIRGLLAFIPALALRFNIKKFAAFAAIIIGYYYLKFTNFPVSAERSYIMASVFFVAILFDRLNSPMRPLALAALILLGLQPEAIFDAGFQMSFAAVGGLIFLYEITKKDESNDDEFLERKYKNSFLKNSAKYFAFLIVSSIVAGAATLPFSIYHFGRYSNYGVLANLFAIPVSTYIIMPLCFVAFLFVNTPLFGFFAGLANTASGWLIDISNYFNSFPKHIVLTPFIPFSFLAIITLLFCGLFFLKSRRRIYFLVPIFVMFILIFNYNKIFSSTPDFVISEKNFVIKNSSGNYFFASGKSSFKGKVWQGKLATQQPEKLKNLNDNCTAKICYFENFLIAKQKPQNVNCDDFEYLINLSNESFCEQKTIVTKEQIKQNGTYLIWKNQTDKNTDKNNSKTLKIKSMRNYEGYRPWNM
jgi:competence protein ComEC